MPNAVLVNFAGGETSPKSRGRFDIASYNSSCRKMVNFIAEVSGPARYRPGFKYVAETRGSQAARLIPFQFNDAQAYMLEFTPGKMRVFKDGAQQLVARTTILSIGYIGSDIYLNLASGTGLATGDTIVITDVVGMTQLNGRPFKLEAGGDATHFYVQDVATGARVDTTGYGAYISGGTVKEPYEIDTPYVLASDLADIQFAQTTDAMYLAHYKYESRKLTMSSAEVFTLATYARTNDPFAVGTALTVTGAGIDGGGWVSLAAGSVIVDGASYLFASVGGMTQLNGNSYLLEMYYSDAYTVVVHLFNPATGVRVDMSGFSAYTSGGTATPAIDAVIASAFYENRLFHAGTNLRPRTLFASMSPVTTTGASRFDTFTGGTAADNACFFSLAPVNGTVDYITWAGGTTKYLLIGTFGGVFRVSGGGGSEDIITPASVNVKQIDAFGCDPVAPALNGGQAFFIQRGGGTLRGIQYSLDSDDLISADMCLNAEQIGDSPLNRVVFQSGRPDMLWVTRDDGVLCGMTVHGAERIAGWHRHKIGGTSAKVLDVAVLPRIGGNDQLYIVAERTINGSVRHYLEVMADDVVFPDFEDFYTGESDSVSDRGCFRGVVYRKQEQCVYVDSALTAYNGSDRCVAVGAHLFAGSWDGAIGATVTIFSYAADGTTPVNVFVASDVGKQIWIKPNSVTGQGGGRMTIATRIDGYRVNGPIVEMFSDGFSHEPEDCFIAESSASGLFHLEGQTVAVVTDGGVHADGTTGGGYATVTVTGGAVTLVNAGVPVFAAVIIVGLPYSGLLQTQNLEMGGRSGPAQSKPRNICEIGIRFLNSLGCEYGTDLYSTEHINHRKSDMMATRVEPVFSGIRKLPHSDTWSSLDSDDEKRVVIAQRLPLPCVVQSIDVQFETGDE